MLRDLPPELLSLVVEGLVREHLYEYFTSEYNPWNATATLLSVSGALRGVTQLLLASGLAIPRLEDGRSSGDPLAAIRLARYDARKRFDEECLKEEDSEDQDLDQDPVGSERAWWRDSPLLELYSFIRETRLHRDRITQQDRHLRRLADLPNKLVDPMERSKGLKDTRLVRPALVEGAYLIACTTFVGQLSASARFFDLVHEALCEAPEWLSEWFDRIDKTLLTTEVLEKGCMVYLYWVRSEPFGFVSASHIRSSRIVPSLRNFVDTPVIDSDPMCDGWRKRVEALLNKWVPLDNEACEHITKEPTVHTPPVSVDSPQAIDPPERVGPTP